MSRIPRKVTEHALRIKPSSKLVQQCLCHFDEEKHKAISKEIAKFLVARFIKEVMNVC
jgi:hypothetical protein